jgi:folate-binding protein YgfZ
MKPHQEITAPADYGSVDDEHRALREACGLVDRSWVARLEMDGADRVRFLNGLVTCDVKPLAPGAGAYGFVTQIKGRVLADLKVLALADRLWLELPAGAGEEISEHLGKYAVFDQVEIRPLDDRLPLSLIGPRAADFLGGIDLPEATLGHRDANLLGTEVLLVREDDLEVPVWTLWTPAEAASSLWAKLLEHGASHGLRPAGHRAWERLRVEAGWPLCGQDYGPDNFPQETGLEDAVSYDKGCYLGQEVVARIHYRGGVKKLLRGLRFTDAADPLGQGVVHDGREAGKVTSAVHSPVYGHVGLAILHKRVTPGARVEIGGGGTADVVALPFELDGE